VQLDDVGDPEDAQCQRAERHGGDRPHAAPPLRARLVRSLIEQPALNRGEVLGPQPLDMDQATLARAEEPVLER
jgi:hypothetical protein